MQVTFIEGGNAVEISNLVSETELEVLLPAGTSTEQVVVTVVGVSSAPYVYTIEAPVPYTPIIKAPFTGLECADAFATQSKCVVDSDMPVQTAYSSNHTERECLEWCANEHQGAANSLLIRAHSVWVALLIFTRVGISCQPCVRL